MACLYDYQTEILRRLEEAWRMVRSVMVQMPTGTGKTHVLAAVVKDFLSDNNGQVWIVAHRRELVAQAGETLARYGIGGADKRVKVVSIQWLTHHRDAAATERGERPTLVIIDEAHHAQAQTYRMLWELWPEAKFLGLTATPCRMNRSGFTDLFDTLIMSWSISEFIRKGRLSPFDYVSIRPDSETQRLIDSLVKRGADGDYQTKEMDSVLNRGMSIGRLYRSVTEFAGGKKGIVYAISIAHARAIAGYYNDRGLPSAAIDSRTPAAERKRLVEDFRTGRLRVLVNVDIFSEGFDSPDVEFVQMARPTLSLAKYLQQVGRGLRKTKGKETCVLIDNVGLCRVFGLPTAAWDWEAMFRGFVAGKARPVSKAMAAWSVASERPADSLSPECDMEVVVSHEQLLRGIAADPASNGMGLPVHPGRCRTDAQELRVWQDSGSGLWGLRRCGRQTAEARFAAVFDVSCDMAAVRFADGSCGIVRENGDAVWRTDGCHHMRFLKDRLAHVVAYSGKASYVDTCSLRVYGQKPKVRSYGNIELLEVGHSLYSRTRTVYVNDQDDCGRFVRWRKFYLSVYDAKTPFPNWRKENQEAECYAGFACILDGDRDGYYWLYRTLADGSIIVMNSAREYFHAVERQPKTYVGCRKSEDEWKTCRAEIERLARQAEEAWQASESERTENRRRLLARSATAIPFQAGMKWGLRVGGRVTVPPIYRSIKSPVGKYCAVEKNYSQWGVVALDGTIVVAPQYPDIEISRQGVVTVTKATGRKMSVKLP